MVYMKLISNENGVIRYSYQPEKKGEHGVLSYDVIKNIPKIEVLAQEDFEHTFYRNHAFRMIRENKNNPPQERLIAWY